MPDPIDGRRRQQQQVMKKVCVWGGPPLTPAPTGLPSGIQLPTLSRFLIAVVGLQKEPHLLNFYQLTILQAQGGNLLSPSLSSRIEKLASPSRHNTHALSSSF